jgi:hypothetical protein
VYYILFLPTRAVMVDQAVLAEGGMPADLAANVKRVNALLS